MDEKRLNPRMRRLKEGRIIFSDKRSLMSVKVRDIGATGARLICGEPYLAPPSFEFAIGSDAEGRPAERVWIKGNEMGIRYLS